MYQPKTKPTRVPVSAYIGAIKSEEHRRDCRALVAMMKRVTGHPAKMWGPSIVGFGTYHYRYETGHEGTICEIGFSSRGSEIVVYLLPDYSKGKLRLLLKKLGTYRTGKSCLYFKRMSEVDPKVLEQLIRHSVKFARVHSVGHKKKEGAK